MSGEVVSLVERRKLVHTYHKVMQMLLEVFDSPVNNENNPPLIPVSFQAWNEEDPALKKGQMCVSIAFKDGEPRRYYVHDTARPWPRPDNPWSEELITNIGDLACKVGGDEVLWQKLQGTADQGEPETEVPDGQGDMAVVRALADYRKQKAE